MRNRVKALQRNAQMRKSLVTVDYTAYNAAAAKRLELPEYVNEKIQRCIQEILIRYPETKVIDLIGSYANGTYIDSKTPTRFANLKKQVYKTVKISDFDFETQPLVLDYFIIEGGLKVHLCANREGRKVNVYN